MRCCFITFSICFSKVAWFTLWFIIFKNNCFTFGEKLEDFNVFLVILRSLDRFEPLKTYAGMVWLMFCIGTA